VKGPKAVQLNQAAMIEVVQHYFDGVLFAEGQSPKVTEVKVREVVHNTVHFTIETEEREATP
jgi:hypothetical protein